MRVCPATRFVTLCCEIPLNACVQLQGLLPCAAGYLQMNVCIQLCYQHMPAAGICTLSGHNAPGHKTLTSWELQKFKQCLWAQCLTMGNPLFDLDHFGITIITAHQILALKEQPTRKEQCGHLKH